MAISLLPWNFQCIHSIYHFIWFLSHASRCDLSDNYCSYCCCGKTPIITLYPSFDCNYASCVIACSVKPIVINFLMYKSIPSIQNHQIYRWSNSSISYHAMNTNITTETFQVPHFKSLIVELVDSVCRERGHAIYANTNKLWPAERKPGTSRILKKSS